MTIRRFVLRTLLGVLCLLPVVSCSAQAWDVFQMHPWVEATADELASKAQTPATRLELTGLGNEWVTGALLVKCLGGDEQSVEVSLEAEAPLAESVLLRVAGFIKQKPDQWLVDPLFEKPSALPRSKQAYMRNFDNIYEFPRTLVTPRDPVLLWVTVKTHYLPPGTHEGALVLSDAAGQQRRVELTVRVGDYKLPTENPLYCYGWQWTPRDPAEKRRWLRWFGDYGINVTHLDHEAAHEVGYRFLLFTFSPSWRGKPLADADPAAVTKAIQRIKETVSRLFLRPDEWAIELADEPSDKKTPTLVEWARHIRSQWPEARFWFNPGWGPGPKNTWATNPGTFEPLAEFADVWCPYSHHLWDPQKPLAITRRTGKPTWFYEILGMSYSRRPSVGRSILRKGPWMCWKYQLQGFGWYGLDEYSDTDPWSDQSAKYTYAIVYPPLIAGRGLEAVRQGFQEYKRLDALRTLGCNEAELDALSARGNDAKTVEEIDAVREDMDKEILRRTR